MSPTTSGTYPGALLRLGEVRQRMADALAPATPADPPVLVDLVDSVDPPAYMPLWVDPWLEPETIAMSEGYWWARLDLLCLAARVDPGPAVAMLEALVSNAISRMAADAYPWPAATLQAPRVFTIAGVPLLGARVSYRLPVSI